VIPFVQGNLLRESLAATIKTFCHHCSQPLEIWVDSDLNFKVLTEGAAPLISVPLKNEKTTRAPNILDDV
jgi:hypothetical protein